MPWAFIFERVDQLPRHPGQLYEAIAYALLFVIMWYIYRRRPQRVGTGFFFGLCLTYIFTFRFFIEYTKEVQVDFENGMLFDMGQLLSVPFILLVHQAVKKDMTRMQRVLNDKQFDTYSTLLRTTLKNKRL